MGLPALPRSFLELRTLRLMSFAYHSFVMFYISTVFRKGINIAFQRNLAERFLPLFFFCADCYF